VVLYEMLTGALAGGQIPAALAEGAEIERATRRTKSCCGPWRTTPETAFRHAAIFEPGGGAGG